MSVGIGILLAIMAMISWGIGDFLAKKAIDKIGYVKSVIINVLAAIVPLLVYIILFPNMLPVSVGLVLITIAVAFLSTVGSFFFYRGMEKGNLSIVSPIASSWVVIVTLSATIIFKEVLTSFQALGILIIFAGIFLASTNLKELRRSVRRGMSKGVPEAMVSMVAWGITLTLNKPLVSMAGPIMALLLMRGGSFLFSSLWGKIKGIDFKFSNKLVLLFLIISGLLDTAGSLAYNFGITTEYVSIVSPVAATYPAVTILLAYIFLKEKVANNQKVGIVAILIGLAIISLI